MSDSYAQLPDDDEPMTWDASPDLLATALTRLHLAETEAMLPNGRAYIEVARLYLLAAQTAELRRIACALSQLCRN